MRLLVPRFSFIVFVTGCFLLFTAQAPAAQPAAELTLAQADSGPRARFPIAEDGKWGLIDSTGAVVVPPEFDALGPCAASSPSSMAPRNTAQAVRDGVTLIDCAPVRQELISVSAGGKWGAIDPDGRQVIPPRFDAIRIWAGFIAARRDDRWGILDRTGSFSVEPRFVSVQPVGPMAAVRIDEKWGLIDTSGAFVLPPQLDRAPAYYRGDQMIVAEMGGRAGLLDLSGEWVVEPRFERIYRFMNGFGNATINGKMGYIDSTGAWVIEPRFDVAAPFGPEGLALVTIGDEEVFIDRTGNVVVKGDFKVLHSFSGGLARAAVGENSNDLKWGYLDTAGRWVAEPVQDWVSTSHEGLSAMTKDGRTSYLDDEGSVVLELDCSGVDFSDGLAGIVMNDKWGYVDRNGVRVIEPRYDRGYEYQFGLAKVLLGDRIAYIDRSGREVYVMEFPDLRKNVMIR